MGSPAMTMDRPGLCRLRELVNTKAITAAIVDDPDRLSRKLGHQLLLTEQMDRAGVQLLIVSHPLDHGPEGMVLFQVGGIFAEYEHAKLMERTHRGRVKRAEGGRPVGTESMDIGPSANRTKPAGRSRRRKLAWCAGSSPCACEG